MRHTATVTMKSLEFTYFHRYCYVFGIPWQIIMDSGLDNLIYWHLLLKSLLFTINYSATANLRASQITRTCYPFPGNGFITGTFTSNHHVVFLSFLVQSPWNADPPDLDPVLQFNFSNPPSYRHSLYSLGTDHIEDTFLLLGMRVYSSVT
jgi:hypothetical protein